MLLKGFFLSLLSVALLAAAAAWVGSCVDIGEIGCVDVGVDFSCVDAGVAQELLDVAEIGAGSEYVCCAGVAYGVRVDPAIDAGLPGCFAHDFADRGLREAIAGCGG